MIGIMWGIIGDGFSKPFSREDTVYSYLPTQIVAARLAAEQFGGIIYRSSLTMTDGLNVVLFEKQTAEQIPNVTGESSGV